MKLAGRVDMDPRKLGEKIKHELNHKCDFIKEIMIMGPGFINFYLKEASFIKGNINSVENGDFKSLELDKKNVKTSIVLNKLSDILKLQNFRAFMNMYYLASIYNFAGFKVRKLVVVRDHDNDVNIKYFLSNFKNVEITSNKKELKDSITFCSTVDQGIFRGLDYKRFILEGVNIYKNGFQMHDVIPSELVEQMGLDRIKYTLCSKALVSEINIELTEDKLRYIQYPYSRITSIIDIFKAKGIDIDNVDDFKEELLNNDLELEMIKKISNFKDVISDSTTQNQPYKLIKYTNDLCEIFYKINTSTLYRQLSTEKLVALLKLLNSFRIVLKEILDILELPVYEKM